MTRLSVSILVAALMLCSACPASDDDAEMHLDEVSSDAGSTPDSKATVSGIVSRTVEPSDDGDATGTIYIVALEACDLMAPVVGAHVLPAADLSERAASETFELALPKRKVALAAFLDDNEDAESTQPRPGSGPGFGRSGAE